MALPEGTWLSKPEKWLLTREDKYKDTGEHANVLHGAAKVVTTPIKGKTFTKSSSPTSVSPSVSGSESPSSVARSRSPKLKVVLTVPPPQIHSALRASMPRLEVDVAKGSDTFKDDVPDLTLPQLRFAPLPSHLDEVSLDFLPVPPLKRDVIMDCESQNAPESSSARLSSVRDSLSDSEAAQCLAESLHLSPTPCGMQRDVCGNQEHETELQAMEALQASGDDGCSAMDKV